MKRKLLLSSSYVPLLLGFLVLFGLYLTRFHSYLLFHSLTEIFSVIIAGSVFALAWNARQLLDNDYLLFIGIAYLFVAGIDLLHTLAYKGVGVFPTFGTDLPTQLWIAARYVQSLSLLVAPLFLRRKLNIHLVFLAFSAISAFLLFTIFYTDIFPTCYVEGVGLAPFKKISEYVISSAIPAFGSATSSQHCI
jgi:hypothetical protein